MERRPVRNVGPRPEDLGPVPSETDAILDRARALEAEAARLRALAHEAAGHTQADAHPEAGETAPRPPDAWRATVRERALLDSTTQFAIVVTDPDGRVIDWNVGAERILGWSADTMRGQTVERLFTPEDRAAGRPEAEMRIALARGRADDERWHMRADGGRFWASGELMPLRDEAGVHLGFVKILRDRTPEHVAGRALEGAQARLRRAQEAGGVGLFTVEIADDLMFPTPELCRLFGLPVQERCSPRLFEERVLPEDVGLASSAASRTRGEPVHDAEYRIRRGDTGEVRWIARKGEIERDAQGRPVRFVGAGRDVTERRAAEERLRASEARYRALFDAIDDGFCIIEFFDGPHGPLSDYVHVEANSGYARHTGIANIVGRTLRDVAAGDAEGWAALYGGVLRTGEPVRFERAFAEVGRHIEVSAARIEPASRRQVSVLFRDITARKQAETALRESEAQFRVLAQTIPSQVWAARPDGDLHWFNAQTYEYCGLAAGALDGAEAWGRIVHPDDRPAAAQAWARSLATGAVCEVEFRLRRTDGAYRWFLARAEPVRDADGAVTGWVGTNTDIHERHSRAMALEREVAERTADRNALWQLSRDLMLRYTFEGVIAAVNPAWTEMLGWHEEALLGTSLFALIHPDDLGRTMEGAVQLAAGLPHARLDNRYRTRDGGYRWIAWTTRSSEGLINAVGRDVTGEREQAEALARAEEALRQSQKMEAVGQLTGGLAHDFNNLLAGISGSLELMDTRISQGRLGDVGKYMVAAQGAARRAAALTHRLLAFSRQQTLAPKAINVNALVSGMLDLVQRTVGPGIQVETVGASGLWPALVDPSQLENALLNLCINARDAMPEGGRITIETANRWIDRHAAARQDMPEGQYLSLCVSDTGTGMPADVVAKAFDPFFTTKPIGQGTGLGLSMIYGFARQSGGQARIYSEVGEGTTVCIYLPRYRGAEDADEAGPEPGAVSFAQAGETVLVVDDEPTVRLLVTDVLEDLGYTALEAADSAEGLRLLRSDVRVDLLVTDVGLPGGMNGRQMVDAARMRRPNLKVLFITGFAENALLNNGRLEPGMAVLTKPFAVDTLAARIHELIALPVVPRREG